MFISKFVMINYNKKKHKDKKHFYINGLQCFRIEEILAIHCKVCLEINHKLAIQCKVCLEVNDKQRINMSDQCSSVPFISYY